MYKNKKLLPQRTPRAQSRTRCAFSVLSVSSVVNPFTLRRSGMSLIEVLISMFVMLFGLMGVAAIFPVGNHYVVEGEKYDLASGIAQNAFEELRARGMLKPEVWLAADSVPGTELWVMQQAGANAGLFMPRPSNADPSGGPGHAFVIDPMGAASALEVGDVALRFPRFSPDNPWQGAPYNLFGTGWPARRITLPTPDPTLTYPAIPMTAPVAETIFRLRDDLAVEQPKQTDVPSIQRWDVDTNGTPLITTDDLLLRRQYKGNYSWLATIVPTTGDRLAALQPANADYGNRAYDVSVVIFRKRDETPSAESERLIEAELLDGGEIVIYSTNGTTAKDDVDDALEDIRPGTWISLMGVNQTTGDFVMKWYRLLSLDDKEETGNINTPGAGAVVGRRAMLIGPDWPMNGATFSPNLRAGLFPGVISVVTKPLRMEATSLWSLD